MKTKICGIRKLQNAGMRRHTVITFTTNPNLYKYKSGKDYCNPSFTVGLSNHRYILRLSAKYESGKSGRTENTCKIQQQNVKVFKETDSQVLWTMGQTIGKSEIGELEICEITGGKSLEEIQQLRLKVYLLLKFNISYSQ